MSSYHKETKHPHTGEWENALWYDDFYGNHHYGVYFSSNEMTYDPEKVKLETRNCTCVEMSCPKDCKRKHTCHTYSCEKCQQRDLTK